MKYHVKQSVNHRPGFGMSGAFAKDMLRMWARNWKRFASIAIITMLGVAVLTGIYAGCRDMFRGADRFLDSQRLYDIQIVSTLGLTDDDAAALKAVNGVERVQTERSAAATVTVNGSNESVTLTEIGTNGMNQPYLQEGRLPVKSGEVAVTKKFVRDSGLMIGDRLNVALGKVAASASSEKDKSDDATASGDAGNESSGDDSTPTFPTDLTITGIVLDPLDLQNPEGYSAGAFRSSATTDYTFFLPSDGVSGTVYTAISLEVEGASALDTFTDRYDDVVRAVRERIETTIQAKRQQARRQQLIDEANQRIADARAKADRQIAEAQAELDKQAASVESSIPQARWYVNTRSTAGTFSSLESDLNSIESIGRAFPVVFLLVAVLMSLTTMTRMVEEDRGLIGTYMGLGYGNALIASRYVLFALLACLIGGGLGDLIGFLGIPAFLLVVLEGMYVVPGVTLLYDWAYGSAGVLLFVVGVAVATIVACRGEVRHMPAELMRPKSPKSGSRVLLERIGPLWRRMKFLNKVTARNLFRFKGRLFMTVGGVAGCTALIVCGLAINDTVDALPVTQYQDVYRYDLMVVTDHDALSPVRSRLLESNAINDSTTPAAGALTLARVESGEITTIADSGGAGESETVQLITVPYADQLTNIADFRSSVDGTTIRTDLLDRAGRADAESSGIIVSLSAANAMGVEAGDKVALENGDAARETVRVYAVSRSVIGADVYMTSEYYREVFGGSTEGSGSADESDGDGSGADSASNSRDYTATEVNGVEMNAIFAQFVGSDDDQIDYADRLAKEQDVLSVTSTADMRRRFSFDLMGAVVALIVALAGALALVVLFTLANTNVSERVREMATLKVLGFFDREVHTYVNREMLILTLMGIAVGLPLGRWIGGLLTAALNMPGLYFAVTVRWYSYAIAAAVTLAFALLVQLLTNPVLDRIDPVSSLKSVE
ncbi:FtsX-like permease family protein [Bifidobacterium olomucense]|uniref:FtsX-like permease family protein n=1 Tax=Bifidobacterium olomucense TaxID=2675324 RepID=UPI003AA83127